MALIWLSVFCISDNIRNKNVLSDNRGKKGAHLKRRGGRIPAYRFHSKLVAFHTLDHTTSLQIHVVWYERKIWKCKSRKLPSASHYYMSLHHTTKNNIKLSEYDRLLGQPSGSHVNTPNCNIATIYFYLVNVCSFTVLLCMNSCKKLTKFTSRWFSSL